MRPDNDANERVYHKKLSAEDIVFKRAETTPAAARPMIFYLNRKARKNLSESKPKS